MIRPDRPLRVALASPSFGTYGGVQAVMLAIARHMQVQGIEVRVCFKLVQGSVVAPSLRQVLADSGVDYGFTGSVASSRFLAVLRWADVLHVHTPSPDIVAVGRLLRRPTVVTVYNHKPGDRSRVAKSRVAMLLSARVWFISDYVAETWGMPQAPPRYEKAPTVADLPAGAMPPETRRGFVSVARLIENKGLDDLVVAYGRAQIRHAEQPLTIIGEGPLRSKLAALAAASGAGEHISFSGFLDPDARNEAIRTARWLVAPAKTMEDLGLTPLEARNVGVPCIVTRDGGLPEAGGREALMCDPGDIEGLTRCIETAAHANQAEYAARSGRTYRELQTYLMPLSWFSDRYRALAHCAR